MPTWSTFGIRTDWTKLEPIDGDRKTEDLIDWQIQEDNNLLTVLNLSQLGFLAFPLLETIIPLLTRILKKNKIKDIGPVGKSILNFQISWNLLLFSLFSEGLLIILVQLQVSLFYAFVIIGGGLYLYI